MIRRSTASPSSPSRFASRTGVEHAAVVARHDLGEAAHGARPVGQQLLGHLRAGLLVVAYDERPQLLGDVLRDRAEVDELGVHPLVLEVEHVRRPAAHAGREVASRRAEHEHATAGHVLAAVVAHALDDRGHAGVADAEPLPHPAADEHLARRRAVPDDVAGDDLLVRREGRGPVRADHQPPAGQPLADVVVGVALEPQRHSTRAGTRRTTGPPSRRRSGRWCRAAAPRRRTAS